jgi:hypothetical protein
MHTQDLQATFDIWKVNWDAAVKTARADQCRVEDVSTIGGGDDDDACVTLEAVHLCEDLVERLLALIVASATHTAASTACSLAADRIDLINENDAWCVLLRLAEKVTNT